MTLGWKHNDPYETCVLCGSLRPRSELILNIPHQSLECKSATWCAAQVRAKKELEARKETPP